MRVSSQASHRRSASRARHGRVQNTAASSNPAFRRPLERGEPIGDERGQGQLGDRATVKGAIGFHRTGRLGAVQRNTISYLLASESSFSKCAGWPGRLAWHFPAGCATALDIGVFAASFLGRVGTVSRPEIVCLAADLFPPRGTVAGEASELGPAW